MADDDDRETNRQEYEFCLLCEKMRAPGMKDKVRAALVGILIDRDHVDLIMDALDQYLHPKAKR